MKKADKKLLKEEFKHFLEILEDELENEKQFTDEILISGSIPIKKGKYIVCLEFKKSLDEKPKEVVIPESNLMKSIRANKEFLKAQVLSPVCSNILRKHFESIAPIITFGVDFGQGLDNGREPAKESIGNPFNPESVANFMNVPELKPKNSIDGKLNRIKYLINNMNILGNHSKEQLLELKMVLDQYFTYI